MIEGLVGEIDGGWVLSFGGGFPVVDPDAGNLLEFREYRVEIVLIADDFAVLEEVAKSFIRFGCYCG